MVLVWSLSPVVGPVCTATTSAPSIQVGTTLEAGEGSGHQGRRSGGHPAWWQESGKRLPRPRTFLEPAAQPENLIFHLDFKVQARVSRINIEYLYKATGTSEDKPPRL